MLAPLHTLVEVACDEMDSLLGATTLQKEQLIDAP